MIKASKLSYTGYPMNHVDSKGIGLNHHLDTQVIQSARRETTPNNTKLEGSK